MEWIEEDREKKWDYFYNKVIRFIIFAIISKIEFGYNVYRGIKGKKKEKKVYHRYHINGHVYRGKFFNIRRLTSCLTFNNRRSSRNNLLQRTSIL